MGRKDLLAGLLDAKLPAGNPIKSEPRVSSANGLNAAGGRGAIGAVSRSFEQLKAQAVTDLSPDDIEASPVADRLPSSSEDNADLVASIRDHGQQVPILVRPHPENEGKFQIAYGRRRVRACAELGRPVRAIIRSLSDSELVVAQGQENSARADLSFIERALFASQLEQAGYGRDTIMAALSVDKTGLSRLISSAVKIPRDIVEAIGAAPKAGRDRWVELAGRIEKPSALITARRLLSEEGFSRRPTDERFTKLFDALAPKPKKAIRPTIWKSDEGLRVARIREDENQLQLAIDKKVASDFGAFVVSSLPELYAAYKRRKEA